MLPYLEKGTILCEKLREFVDVLSAGIGTAFPDLVEIGIYGDEERPWPDKDAIFEEVLDVLMLRYEYGVEIQ